jgi:hypothetical protein
MRFAVGVLLCLNAGAVSLALADPSPSAPAPETAAPAAAAPAAAPAAGPATSARAATPPAAARPEAPAKPAVDPEENRLISQGYKPEMRNGQKVFCRREASLGSRFETKMCATAEQLKSVSQNGKDIVEDAQRRKITAPVH